VVGATRLECGEPAAKAGELIRRQLSDSFGDLFDFHAAQYSTAGAWLSHGLRSVAEAGKGLAKLHDEIERCNPRLVSTGER
jgi:hypothetical protein